MRLYVEPMDATVVDVQADGRVRLENETWSAPTLQERRAIIYEAQKAIAELQELIETLTLQDGRTAGLQDCGQAFRLGNTTFRQPPATSALTLVIAAGHSHAF